MSVSNFLLHTIFDKQGQRLMQQCVQTGKWGASFNMGNNFIDEQRTWVRDLNCCCVIPRYYKLGSELESWSGWFLNQIHVFSSVHGTLSFIWQVFNKRSQSCWKYLESGVTNKRKPKEEKKQKEEERTQHTFTLQLDKLSYQKQINSPVSYNSSWQSFGLNPILRILPPRRKTEDMKIVLPRSQLYYRSQRVQN